jgi:hypothetical protein
MDSGSTVDDLGDALVGFPVDVLEHVLDALHDSQIEVSNLSHDDVVKIVGAAVTAAAGARTKHYLEQHRSELQAAEPCAAIVGSRAVVRSAR